MFANKAHEEAYNLSKAGKLDEALTVFENAIFFSPENPDVYGDRGVLFIHMNNKDSAMSDFNKAIELQPDYGFRYSARAYAHEFFGDTESSVKDYEKAIELDPSDAVAYNNLGLMQEKLGYKQMAQTNFDLADKLAKQEKKLHAIIDDLENHQSNEISENDSSPAQVEEQKTVTLPEEKVKKEKNAFAEFSKLFTSMEQFKSFLKFLKNGFKIK